MHPLPNVESSSEIEGANESEAADRKGNSQGYSEGTPLRAPLPPPPPPPGPPPPHQQHNETHVYVPLSANPRNFRRRRGSGHRPGSVGRPRSLNPKDGLKRAAQKRESAMRCRDRRIVAELWSNVGAAAGSTQELRSRRLANWANGPGASHPEELAGLLQPAAQSHYAVVSNVEKLLSKGLPKHSAFRATLANAMTSDLTPQQIKNAIPRAGITKRVREQGRALAKDQCPLSNDRYSQKKHGRKKINRFDPALCEAMVEHAKSNMHVTSGSARDTYILAMRKRELYAMFRCDYPKILLKIEGDITSKKLRRHLVKASEGARIAKWSELGRIKKRQSALLEMCGRSARSSTVLIEGPGPVQRGESDQSEPVNSGTDPKVRVYNEGGQLQSDSQIQTSTWRELQQPDIEKADSLRSQPEQHNIHLKTLLDDVDLNDGVVNDYLTMLAAELWRSASVRVWAVDSSWRMDTPSKGDAKAHGGRLDSKFRRRLWQVGAKAPKLNLEDVDLVFAPYNPQWTPDKLLAHGSSDDPRPKGHWVLVVWWLQSTPWASTPGYCVLDSLKQQFGSQAEGKELIKQLMRRVEVLADSNQDPVAEPTPPAYHPMPTPFIPQPDYVSCGLYVCMFALLLIGGVGPASFADDVFAGTSLSQFRRRLALDLDDGRLHYTLPGTTAPDLRDIWRGHSKSTRQDDAHTEASDEETIVPPSYKWWWRTLLSWRDQLGHRLKIKICKLPESCPVCEDYDVAPKEMEAVRSKMQELEEQTDEVTASREYADLKKEKKKLEGRLEDIERHRLQFKMQRAYLQRREINLPPKRPGNYRIIVYEDYVAQYSATGKKVSNLVFTVIWRDEEGNLQRKYIDNFCTDKKAKQDSYFTIWVWRAHLRVNLLQHQLSRERDPVKRSALQTRLRGLEKTGLTEFTGVTHLLRTGDSGGHFHSKAVLLFESEVFSAYGIKWETHTLCKRHAWGLCDAHGGAVKRHAQHEAVQGNAPVTALEFARIINDCEHQFGNAKAYAFTTMVSTQAKLRAEFEPRMRSALPGVKKACEFQYHITSEDGREIRRPGYIRMRVHSRDPGDNEDFFTCDILKRPDWGNMCSSCTYLNQRPTYHNRPGRKTTCPNSARPKSHHSLRVVQPKSLLEDHASASAGTPAASLLKTANRAKLAALSMQKEAASLLKPPDRAKLAAALGKKKDDSRKRDSSNIETVQAKKLKKPVDRVPGPEASLVAQQASDSTEANILKMEGAKKDVTIEQTAEKYVSYEEQRQRNIIKNQAMLGQLLSSVPVSMLPAGLPDPKKPKSSSDSEYGDSDKEGDSDSDSDHDDAAAPCKTPMASQPQFALRPRNPVQYQEADENESTPASKRTPDKPAAQTPRVEGPLVLVLAQDDEEPWRAILGQDQPASKTRPSESDSQDEDVLSVYYFEKPDRQGEKWKLSDTPSDVPKYCVVPLDRTLTVYNYEFSPAEGKDFITGDDLAKAKTARKEIISELERDFELDGKKNITPTKPSVVLGGPDEAGWHGKDDNGVSFCRCHTDATSTWNVIEFTGKVGNCCAAKTVDNNGKPMLSLGRITSISSSPPREITMSLFNTSSDNATEACLRGKWFAGTGKSRATFTTAHEAVCAYFDRLTTKQQIPKKHLTAIRQRIW